MTDFYLVPWGTVYVIKCCSLQVGYSQEYVVIGLMIWWQIQKKWNKKEI